MKKQQIESSQVWKYISGLSNRDRYIALTGKNAALFEERFNVKLEEWSFAQMMDIPDEWASISVVDQFRNVAFIMVAKPKKP